MRQFDVELAIGDSVRVQDQLLTVIDIHDGEITFRLDQADGDGPSILGTSFDSRATPR